MAYPEHTDFGLGRHQSFQKSVQQPLVQILQIYTVNYSHQTNTYSRSKTWCGRHSKSPLWERFPCGRHRENILHSCYQNNSYDYPYPLNMKKQKFLTFQEENNIFDDEIFNFKFENRNAAGNSTTSTMNHHQARSRTSNLNFGMDENDAFLPAKVKHTTTSNRGGDLKQKKMNNNFDPIRRDRKNDIRQSENNLRDKLIKERRNQFDGSYLLMDDNADETYFTNMKSMGSDLLLDDDPNDTYFTNIDRASQYTSSVSSEEDEEEEDYLPQKKIASHKIQIISSNVVQNLDSLHCTRRGRYVDQGSSRRPIEPRSHKIQMLNYQKQRRNEMEETSQLQHNFYQFCSERASSMGLNTPSRMSPLLTLPQPRIKKSLTMEPQLNYSPWPLQLPNQQAFVEHQEDCDSVGSYNSSDHTSEDSSSEILMQPSVQRRRAPKKLGKKNKKVRKYKKRKTKAQDPVLAMQMKMCNDQMAKVQEHFEGGTLSDCWDKINSYFKHCTDIKNHIKTDVFQVTTNPEDVTKRFFQKSVVEKNCTVRRSNRGHTNIRFDFNVFDTNKDVNNDNVLKFSCQTLKQSSFQKYSNRSKKKQIFFPGTDVIYFWNEDLVIELKDSRSEELKEPSIKFGFQLKTWTKQCQIFPSMILSDAESEDPVTLRVRVYRDINHPCDNIKINFRNGLVEF